MLWSTRGAQVVGISVDSQFTHLAFSTTPRNKGGLGGCKFPLLADITKKMSRDYEVLIESGDDAGISLRCANVMNPRLAFHTQFVDSPECALPAELAQIPVSTQPTKT